MITQTYNLNLVPGGIPVRVHASQYDAYSSRKLIFHLYNGSTPFTVPTGAEVTCDGIKPDRKGFSYTVDSVSGNTVIMSIRQQMTPVAGEVECQLTITKSTQRLGTGRFILMVERAALPKEADLSKTELDAVTVLANRAAASAQTAQQAAEGTLFIRGTYTGDLNSVTETGAYWVDLSNCTGGPGVMSGYGYLEVWKTSNSAYFQRFTIYSTGVSYFRAYTNGQWYDWVCQNTLQSLSTHGTYSGNLNALNAPGVYWVDLSSCTNGPLSSGYGYVEVWRASSLTWFQRFTRWLGTGGPEIAIRVWSNNDSKFMDWGWDSPPMVAGTEYLTTERRSGKAVYTKIVSCGILPVKTTKEVSHGCSGIVNVIRAEGSMSNGRTVPFNNGTLKAEVSADKNSIIISTNFESSATAQVQIWYTKD